MGLALLFALLFCGSAAAGEPLAWLGVTEIATGGGERGPWQQNDSRYDFVDDPTVAIDERGDILVAWVDQAKKDVFFERRGPDASPRGEPLNISRTRETFSWLPRIALAPRDPQRIFVLWQEIIFSGGTHGGDILFARSEDGGASFAPPVNLSRSRAGDGKGRLSRDLWHNGSLDLAAGADGAVYAAWTEYEGALWLSVSSDGGRTFSPPRHIAGDNQRPARAPALAIGPDRTLYLAWTVGEDRAADIRIARSTDGGASFGEPRVVARTREYSDAPKLAFDRRGTLHLAFGEGNRIAYTRSSDGARSFEPLRLVSAAGAGFPSLATDAQGGVYVLWELLPNPQRRSRGLGIAVSRDEGASFSAQASVPQSADARGGWNGSSQGLLMRKLAVSPRGDIVIANSSLREGEASRVWLIRARNSPSGS